MWVLSPLASNHCSRLGTICFIPAGNEHEAARFRDRCSSAHAQCDIDVCFDEIAAPSIEKDLHLECAIFRKRSGQSRHDVQAGKHESHSDP